MFGKCEKEENLDKSTARLWKKQMTPESGYELSMSGSFQTPGDLPGDT